MRVCLVGGGGGEPTFQRVGRRVPRERKLSFGPRGRARSASARRLSRVLFRCRACCLVGKWICLRLLLSDVWVPKARPLLFQRNLVRAPVCFKEIVPASRVGSVAARETSSLPPPSGKEEEWDILTGGGDLSRLWLPHSIRIVSRRSLAVGWYSVGTFLTLRSRGRVSWELVMRHWHIVRQWVCQFRCLVSLVSSWDTSDL